MSAVVFFGLDECQRQLTIRGLAIQALWNPGFKMACREAAEALHGAEMFDQFVRLLDDVVKPAPAT